MTKEDYELWINYHMNPKSNYTKEEMSEIRASEFAMDLLIPTDKLLELCGGIKIIKEMNDVEIIRLIKHLKDVFDVDEEVLYIKINKVIKHDNERNVKKLKKKKF